MNYSKEKVDAMKSRYPVGTRIEIISLCNEEIDLQAGLRGTVTRSYRTYPIPCLW
ncbi:MAG: DUF4314 domain-containing protein [Clostridiales Family XIII bacterium]|nr:DUF4314 domain-containing protein [Clostridiales Family XIII bacterium]